jgi:hypothetical protein
LDIDRSLLSTPIDQCIISPVDGSHQQMRNIACAGRDPHATAGREAMNTSVGIDRRNRQVIAIGRWPSCET